jgi:cobalt-zinc-cadmium efflux system protein
VHSHHTPTDEKSTRRLLIATVLTGSFMIVEVIGGVLSGSLALLADAGHMLTDTLALGLAWAAFRFSEKPADDKRSFGYQRLQILAALINSLSLIVVVGWILFEAANRLLHPSPIMGGMMLVVASIGMLVNLTSYFILSTASQDNLNLTGASLLVLGDLLGSVGAIVAASIILLTGWLPIDPLLSVFVAMLILRAAWKLLRKSSHILLEGAPEWLDIKQMRRTLVSRIPQIKDIHHVHVWSLNAENTLMTMHAVIDSDADQARILQMIKNLLWEDFGIGHSTIELDIELRGTEELGDD